MKNQMAGGLPPAQPAPAIPVTPPRQKAPWHHENCKACTDSPWLGFSNGTPCRICNALNDKSGRLTSAAYNWEYDKDGITLVYTVIHTHRDRERQSNEETLNKTRRIADSNNTTTEPEKARKWSKIFCGENMNRKIMIFTIAVIILMCFYPPWLRTDNIRSEKTPLPSKYGFLLTPPEEINPTRRYNTITASVDIRRLLVQCVIVLLAGGGLAALSRSKNENTDFNDN